MRLLDLPVYPPRVLGVALWAQAVFAWQHSAWGRTLAAAPPPPAPSAGELAEAMQAADQLEEDREWRAYEAQVHQAQLEALRTSSSNLAADYLEERGAAGGGGGGGLAGD